MVRQQLFIGAALIAGVAIGYFVQPEGESLPVREDTGGKRPARLIEDRGDAATVESLRSRIRELEAKLARANEDGESILSNAVERLDVARKERERGPRNHREWMEKMKRDDPAGYARMTNGVARWRQARKARQTERLGYLSAVDTSRMSASARTTHESYQDLISRREQVEERLQDENLGDDERREIMNEMFSIDREMRQTASSERQILLGEVARAIGLEGENARELIQTVGEVYEVTGGGPHGVHAPPPPPNR